MMSSHALFDIHQLPKVSRELAKVYQTHKDTLLYELNNHIHENTLLKEMTSSVPPSVIYDFHRYHIALMSSILEFEDYELLTRSLPWEYRAYHNQGLPYDYFLQIYLYWQYAIEHVLDTQHARELKKVYTWLADAGRAPQGA